MSLDARALLEALCERRDLAEEESEALFGAVVRGELSEVELAGILVALKAKGETPAELAGAARALCAHALHFQAPEVVFADTCGTGGDAHGTVNVSTAVAFVAAAGGLPIAKHGNRSVSSRCGSADVLEALGADIQLSPARAREVLDQTGFCFLFAPQYHAGLRHAMPVRRALRTRTMMNLLGPLVNPARPPVQLMGTFRADLVRPTAETLARLGCQAALVVHGSGLDEIALHGPTQAALLLGGRVSELEITPESVGLSRAPLEALRGGEAADNAEWLRRALAGDAPAAHLDAIALNAGALFWLVHGTPSLADGVARARQLLERGAPGERLDAYLEAARKEPAP